MTREEFTKWCKAGRNLDSTISIEEVILMLDKLNLFTPNEDVKPLVKDKFSLPTPNEDVTPWVGSKPTIDDARQCRSNPVIELWHPELVNAMWDYIDNLEKKAMYKHNYMKIYLQKISGLMNSIARDNDININDLE